MNSHKTWPLTAKAIIILGCIGNIKNIIWFVRTEDMFPGVIGVIGLVIWWHVYHFRLWGLLALNALVLVSILMMFFKAMAGAPLMDTLVGIGIQLALAVYFNNMALNGMFEL